MNPSPRRVALAFSDAVHPLGAVRREAPPDADTPVRLTVVVRARTGRDERRREIERLARQLPSQRQHSNREAFIRRHGASDQDIEAVAAFVTSHGLKVEARAPERRCVVVSGRLADVDRAFGVDSGHYEWHDRVYRSHEGEVDVPENLGGVVLGVLGLDDRPLMRHHAFAAPNAPFTDRQAMAERYRFPADADGSGQTIGIIALGGGYHEADVRDALGTRRQVRAVELGGERNQPSPRDKIEVLWDVMQRAWRGEAPPRDLDVTADDLDRFKWTVELTSDIENAARFAPGAEIVVYFAPDTIQGKYTAFTTALVEPNGPDVISCSWGTHEREVCRNHAYIMDDVFSFAALRGVTLCYSSGDDGDGSTPTQRGQPAGKRSAHFPATSPYVLACGGTMPAATHTDPEEVWNEDLGLFHMASGGGRSETFRTPWWQDGQAGAADGTQAGRGIPDVAGKADMKSGYRITVGGIEMPIGGTSTVAPMWAALIARLNQKLGGPIGYVTPLLYLERARFAAATRSITRGNNGGFEAAEGWDCCTGWGTPLGVELLRALQHDG